MKLFDDDDASSEEDISKIEINKEFARRYEHNKKREDLMRLEELKKRGLAGDEDSDESSDEDSDASELANPKKDLQFLNALIRVKNRDPVIKEKEVKFFDENDVIEENKGKETKGKKGKPMYLKDVVAKQLIEEGPEFDADLVGVAVKSYAEEQEELRRGLVAAAEKAMDEVDDDGDLFKVKESGNEVEEDDDVVEVEKKLDEYFGKDDNLDENEVFLKKYFRNRMWVGEDEGGKVPGEEGLELSDDEVAIEEQEDYEKRFNFRFEENAGDRILGHSRVVEGSVRKKNNARKAQRERKEEREAEAERERKEELKRLKNLKKKEMREKLMKIKETAGVEGDWVCPLDEDDLEDEFDPEEHDRKMRESFNDEYYGADDVDPEFGSDEEEDKGLKKPDFDKEDELLGLEKGWDEISSSRDGFLAAREKQLKRKAENEQYLEKMVEGEEEGATEEGGKRKKKKKMSKLAKEILEKELEEYYKLDYEDTIGDLKTRFKYREVGPKRYGLSTEEILALDDKELNQYVSIKKLAPYREKEWKVDRSKVLSQKQRNKLLLKGEKLDDQNRKDEKKRRKSEENKPDDDDVDINGDTSNLSRNKRRKLREAEYKLSNSRLMAYGKIPSSSKSKKKH